MPWTHIARLSPYMTEHIKRFGDYLIDIHQLPVKIMREIRRLGLVQWRQRRQ